MLSPLQRLVLAAVGRLDASASFALAGGAALIVHGVANRTTRDLDLFTEESGHVSMLQETLTDELAADKMLALYGRAELRDFLDVADLLERFPKDRLVELAVAKDDGFTLARFTESLAALHRFPDADWETHGAERERITSTFDEWRAALTA